MPAQAEFKGKKKGAARYELGRLKIKWPHRESPWNRGRLRATATGCDRTPYPCGTVHSEPSVVSCMKCKPLEETECRLWTENCRLKNLGQMLGSALFWFLDKSLNLLAWDHSHNDRKIIHVTTYIKISDSTVPYRVEPPNAAKTLLHRSSIPQSTNGGTGRESSGLFKGPPTSRLLAQFSRHILLICFPITCQSPWACFCHYPH